MAGKTEYGMGGVNTQGVNTYQRPVSAATPNVEINGRTVQYSGADGVPTTVVSGTGEVSSDAWDFADAVLGNTRTGYDENLGVQTTEAMTNVSQGRNYTGGTAGIPQPRRRNR